MEQTSSCDSKLLRSLFVLHVHFFVFSMLSLENSLLLILTSAFLAASPIHVHGQRVLRAVGRRTENPATLHHTVLQETCGTLSVDLLRVPVAPPENQRQTYARTCLDVSVYFPGI